MAKLPSITVSDEFSELIRAYAASKRVSVGSAVRVLLTSSQELKSFADENGLTVDPGVSAWGGRRETKPDSGA